MPSTRKGHRTEEAFLAAARECFATLGYLNTKIADIAAAAGRSTASFYNYYDNKEQILEALLGDFATSVVEASLTTGHHDPYEGVNAAVTAYWKMYKEYLPEMIGLQQMALTDPGFRQRLLETRAAGIKQILVGLHRAEDLGYAVDLPLDVLASALTSTLESNCSLWLAVGGDIGIPPPDDETAIRVLSAIWYRTVYGGPTTPS